MPELPEVETVRRGLAPVMEGARLASVEQRRPDLRWPFPERFAERLAGRRVERLGRRSKYLLMEIEGGETLIVHLGMSGRMLIDQSTIGAFHHDAPAPGAHDHVVFTMESGARITFNDARRFGSMDLAETARLAEHRLIAKLGPEPLGNAFSGAHLAERFSGRIPSVKAALLDQRIVAGLGNIYVCEALHRAGVSPKRRCGSISRPRLDALAIAVRETLADAIEAGGSSLRDYRQADGELGYFQHAFRVYGREDAPCPSEGCDGVIRRIPQAGRSSFYCPRCQR